MRRIEISTLGTLYTPDPPRRVCFNTYLLAERERDAARLADVWLDEDTRMREECKVWQRTAELGRLWKNIKPGVFGSPVRPL